MDNVTHSLTGLMMSRALWGRGARGTALMMVLAANAPDLDVVGWFGGSLSYLQMHRGYTHSLLCAPLVAAVPLLLVRLFAGTQITQARYLACLGGVLSHLLMDWTNVYGVRMLLPFSSRWLHLDITDIVDPWIWLILLVAVAAPALSGMVGSEISSRRVKAPVRGWAKAALILLVLFEAGRWVAHARAVGILESHRFTGMPPTITAALPGRFAPWNWRGIVISPGQVYEVPVDLLDDFDPGAGQSYYPVDYLPEVSLARQTQPFRVFEGFNQLPFWRVTKVLDMNRVELIDLRFGTPQTPGFEAVAEIDANEAIRESRFGFGPPPITPRP